MSVLFGKSVKNVNENYNKINIFGFLTLLFIINILPFTIYSIIANKLCYFIITAILWFLVICTHIMAINNAVHNREGIFPGIKDIFNNLSPFLKNGLFLSVFIIFQYIVYIILFLAFNYLLAKSIGINGSFKDVIINILSYLQISTNAGSYSLFFKEITIAILISVIMVVLFIGNYANFVYDLKLSSLFNFVRGFKFLAKAKTDTLVLILKSILFGFTMSILMFIIIFVLSIIVILATHGVPPQINPEKMFWFNIIFSFIAIYFFGFLGIYLFDMIAQYIRTNQENEEITTEE